MQSSESGGCLIFQLSRTLDNTVEIDDSVESGCSRIEIYYKFLHKSRTIYMPVPVHHIFIYFHIWKRKRIYCRYHLHIIGLMHFLGVCCFIPFMKQNLPLPLRKIFRCKNELLLVHFKNDRTDCIPWKTLGFCKLACVCVSWGSGMTEVREMQKSDWGRPGV